MKLKLPLSVLGSLVAAVFLLASCGGGDSGAPTPDEPATAVEAVDEGAPEVPGEASPTESPATAPESEPESEPQPEEEEAVTISDQTPADMKEENAAASTASADPAEGSGNLQVVTLGGGCFWCTEAVMQRVEGVVEVVSGYMGGHVENPTYEQIITKTTGHAEVIQVTYDPADITFEELLDIFWQAHDPTTLNRQGADVGPQYRSVIFYHTPEQRNIAEKSMRALDESGVYPDPAVTEITAASTFWEAEEYHQNYYNLNKDKNPYCRVVISPKLQKLGLD